MNSAVDNGLTQIVVVGDDIGFFRMVNDGLDAIYPRFHFLGRVQIVVSLSHIRRLGEPLPIIAAMQANIPDMRNRQSRRFHRTSEQRLVDIAKPNAEFRQFIENGGFYPTSVTYLNGQGIFSKTIEEAQQIRPIFSVVSKGPGKLHEECTQAAAVHQRSDAFLEDFLIARRAYRS